MNLLHLSDVYFPRVNGVSTSIRTLLRELAAGGHETALVAPRYGADGDGREELEVLRVPARRVPNDREDRWMHAAAIGRLAPQLAARRFDVLHVHTPFVAHHAGVRLARRLGVPLVESYHTFFEEYLRHYVPWAPASWLRRLARRASRAQCDAADAVVVPSTAMHDVLLDYGVRAAPAVIPTGLAEADWPHGDGQRFRARYGIPPTRPVLVHVGRIAFEKNLLFLVDVLEQVRESVPDVLLLVAGEGPAMGALWQHVRARDLERHVLLVGYLARGGELADCYRAGHVFVFASRTETQGLVLLEAMALGVPVVSTAVMGTRDILAPRRGAVVAEESVPAFAGETVALLQDHGRRAALGREAASYARSWTAAAMAERMTELYARLLAERGRAAALS